MVAELRAAGIRATADLRDGLKPGAKYFEWESRGTPLRLEVGPRDLAAGTVMLARRTGGKEPIQAAGLPETITRELDGMQQALFSAALERREAIAQPAEGRYRLMPGLFTTTSACRSVVSLPVSCRR